MVNMIVKWMMIFMTKGELIQKIVCGPDMKPVNSMTEGDAAQFVQRGKLLVSDIQILEITDVGVHAKVTPKIKTGKRRAARRVFYEFGIYTPEQFLYLISNNYHVFK